MKQRKYESYPENVPGPFYVETPLCLTCRAPESVAPELIGFYEDPSGQGGKDHCYFKKQPASAAEIERAIMAVNVSCCGAFHYAGADRAVKELLKRGGQAVSIDYD